jgi:hypothetical protein
MAAVEIRGYLRCPFAQPTRTNRGASMMTRGAIPALFFALAMAWSGSVAKAESLAAKPAAKAAAPAKPTPAAKAADSADPFEETSIPTKPAARTAVPAAPVPPKPETTPAAPAAQEAPSKELEAS